MNTPSTYRMAKPYAVSMAILESVSKTDDKLASFLSQAINESVLTISTIDDLKTNDFIRNSDIIKQQQVDDVTINLIKKVILATWQGTVELLAGDKDKKESKLFIERQQALDDLMAGLTYKESKYLLAKPVIDSAKIYDFLSDDEIGKIATSIAMQMIKVDPSYLQDVAAYKGKLLKTASSKGKFDALYLNSITQRAYMILACTSRHFPSTDKFLVEREKMIQNILISPEYNLFINQQKKRENYIYGVKSTTEKLHDATNKISQNRQEKKSVKNLQKYIKWEQKNRQKAEVFFTKKQTSLMQSAMANSASKSSMDKVVLSRKQDYVSEGSLYFMILDEKIKFNNEYNYDSLILNVHKSNMHSR